MLRMSQYLTVLSHDPDAIIGAAAEGTSTKRTSRMGASCAANDVVWLVAA